MALFVDVGVVDLGLERYLRRLERILHREEDVDTKSALVVRRVFLGERKREAGVNGLIRSD